MIEAEPEISTLEKDESKGDNEDIDKTDYITETEERMKKLTDNLKNNKNLEFAFELSKGPKAEVFLVGGAVRDFLMKKEIKDFDFVVSGLEKDELEGFLQKYGKVSDVESRAFGVFKFRPKNWKGEDLDVALPRAEENVGQGYKDFKIKTSHEFTINDDLSRRDFTINALALNLKTGELIDNFDGVFDLKNKTLRAVGNPKDRFLEDPSRILRALRFSTELDFKIEDGTFKEIKKLSPEIIKTFKGNDGKEKTRVSGEVLASEFLKGFSANPVKLLDLYEKTGILKLVFPELEAEKGVEQPQNFHSEGDVWIHTKLALEKLPKDASVSLKLATLFHDVGKPKTQTFEDRIRFTKHNNMGEDIAKQIFKRLPLSSPFSKDHELYIDDKEVLWLVKNHMICVSGGPEMRAHKIEQYFLRPDGWGDELMALSHADISATILEKTKKPDYSSYNKLKKRINEIKGINNQKNKAIKPIFSGSEIIDEFGVNEGPEVGKILTVFRELQLRGKIKNKKEALGLKNSIRNHLKKSPDEIIDLIK